MNFATIHDGIVQNIIVANSKQIAEQITGLQCIAYTDENPAHIGLGYDGTTFEQPKVIKPEKIDADTKPTA
jgi:hypothetical protein